MRVMPTKPMKLQMTLMTMASPTPIERVPTGSAMALAASVEPFTKMDPKIRTMTTTRKGLWKRISRK